MFLKLDLEKTLNSVNCSLLTEMLFQFCLNQKKAKSISKCFFAPSFVVQGSLYNFFSSPRDTKQGYPHSPFLVIIMVEGFERSILEVQQKGCLQGPQVQFSLWSFPDIQFVNNILLTLATSVKEAKMFLEDYQALQRSIRS